MHRLDLASRFGKSRLHTYLPECPPILCNQEAGIGIAYRGVTILSSAENCAFKEGHGSDLQAGLPIMLTTWERLSLACGAEQQGD